MKNKNVMIPVLAVLVSVLLLVSGYLLWGNKGKTEEEVVSTGLPSGIVKVENVADLDNMAKEIDSEKIDIDSGLKDLDRDFSSF